MQLLIPVWLLPALIITHIILMLISLVVLFRSDDERYPRFMQVIILMNIPVLGPAAVIMKNAR
jgi:hypothetical protein